MKSCAAILFLWMFFVSCNGVQQKRPPLCSKAKWDSQPMALIGTGGAFQPQDIDQQPKMPTDVALDSEGNIIITDTGKHRIQKYYLNGTVKTLYASKNIMPVTLFVDQYDNIYFTDHDDNTVKKLTKNGIMTIVAGTPGKIGSQLNQLASPYGIYVDRQDALYIADAENNRIMKYLPNNRGIHVIVSNDLNVPTGIYIDEDGDGALYVSDTWNHRIQKYLPNASTGVTVAGGLKLGEALNQLWNPFAVFADSTTGTLFIADWSNGRIVKWAKGAKQGEVMNGMTKLSDPASIRFDNEWNLYVVEQGKQRVSIFGFYQSSCKN